MDAQKKKLFKLFQEAIKKGDNEALSKLLIGQLGILLGTNKRELIELVKESGGKISDSISDKELAEKIAFGLLNKNQFFIDGLIKMVFGEAKFSNAGGLIDPVDYLAKGITFGIGAIGEGIANKKYGGQIRAAKKGEEKINKRNQALAIAAEILNKKESRKATAFVLTEEERLQAEKKKEEGKTNLIIYSAIALTIGFIVVFKIAQR